MTKITDKTLAVVVAVDQGWKKVATATLLARPGLETMRFAADSKEALFSVGWLREEVRKAELPLQPGYERNRILAAGTAPRHRFQHVLTALARLVPAYPLVQLAELGSQVTLSQGRPTSCSDEFTAHVRTGEQVSGGHTAVHGRTKHKRTDSLLAVTHVALTRKPLFSHLRGMIVRRQAPRLWAVACTLGGAFLSV